MLATLYAPMDVKEDIVHFDGAGGRLPALLLLSAAHTLPPASVKAPLLLPVSMRTTAGL